MMNISSESINNQADNQDAGLIDWGVLFGILYDSFFKILIVTLIAFFAGVIYTAYLPNTYTAMTNIHLEMLDDYSSIVYKEFSVKNSDDRLTYFGTQLKIMQSNIILERTAKTLKLPERLGMSMDSVLGQLRGQIAVNLIHGTDIISIVVNGNDPFMTADIANGIANSFIKYSFEHRVLVPNELMKMISNNEEILPATGSLNQLRSMADESRLTTLPSLTQDHILGALKQELLDLQNQITVLSSRYTRQHPKIQDLRLKEKLLKQQIAQRTQHLLNALKSVIEGDFNVNNVSILDAASPPRSPTGPRRMHITFVFTMVGLMSSMSFIVFFSYFHRKIERAEDLRMVPDVAFLGYVPEIQVPKTEKLNSRQYILKQMNSNSQLSDCLHDIRNNLLFSMAKGQNKTILCCSLLPDEGKSVVTCMLAMAMAAVGEKVLIIDADMRDPSIHLSFGQENTFGFSNCLIEMTSWKYLLRAVDDMPNLKVLCAGTTAPNSTALLSSQQLVRIINEMKEEFGLIILDAPPLLQIPDAFVISEKVDGVVFIIKSGSVEVSLIDQVKNKMKALRINLVGIVINKVDLKRVFKGYYQSFYGSKNKK